MSLIQLNSFFNLRTTVEKSVADLVLQNDEQCEKCDDRESHFYYLSRYVRLVTNLLRAITEFKTLYLDAMR